MLKLHGPGDPTGREEGFSFIRASMKEMFFRANENVEELLALMEQRPKSYHKFSIAEQQIVYKSEIDRIWTNQLNALTSTEEPTLSEDENDEYEERNKNADETRKKVNLFIIFFFLKKKKKNFFFFFFFFFFLKKKKKDFLIHSYLLYYSFISLFIDLKMLNFFFFYKFND